MRAGGGQATLRASVACCTLSLARAASALSSAAVFSCASCHEHRAGNGSREGSRGQGARRG
eukprot:536517-Prorocentrum_minimum.AAC.1